ncbi:MAG: hypothetical protein HOI02_08365 [Rhodospirillaceae bacterium]|nr:hypothetical protein [Rhodospirillaceae bacterium]
MTGALRLAGLVQVAVLLGCLAGSLALKAQETALPDFFAAFAAYERGEFKAAHKMWLVLANHGDVDAQFNIAALYDNGLGVERNVEKAALWYDKAAARNVGPAELVLAHILRRGEVGVADSEQALRRLRSAAHRGSAHAQFELGVAYDWGAGVTQNYATAAVWYEKAAAQGVAEAKYNLATLYDEGLGAPKDHAVALAWYREAARGGNAMAENNIGNLYEKGLGVAQNYALAIEWYARAAKRGLAIGQTNLAIMYHLGHGVARDFKEAARWYRSAAGQGEQTAQNSLGLLLANGLGVARNFIEATQWFLLAAGGPDKVLALRASNNSRDLAAQLVGDELATVQAAVDSHNAALKSASKLGAKRRIPLPVTTQALGHRTVTAQRLLVALGYYDGAVDGLIGPLTLEAMELARRKEGLEVAAKVSDEFITALDQVYHGRSN